MTDCLRPTHECFNDAIEYIVLELKEGNRAALDYLVVHGICLIPGTNERYSHAWVQAGDNVVEGYLYGDERVFAISPRADFERALRPQRTTHYTLMQWHEKNVVSGHYGPWEDEYRALCNDGKDKKAFPLVPRGPDAP